MSSIRDTERPLTARSIVASTLIGLDPPVLPVRRLVEMAELFGISEGTARVALSRMAAAGEVVAEDGRYRLVGDRLLARKRMQDEARRPRRKAWRRRWRLAVVVAERRTAADRAALRASLTGLRLAEWREGVWIRPDNLDLRAPPLALEHCSWATAALDDDDAEVAASLWDLGRWASRARGLLDELRSAPAVREDTLAPQFVLGSAILRHLRTDPLLPDELAGPEWPGDELRAAYDDWERGYRAVLRDWYRSLDEASPRAPQPPG